MNNSFIVLLVVMIIMYYNSIVIYESAFKPNFSLNWPLILRISTGFYNPDSSLQDFLDEFLKQHNAECMANYNNAHSGLNITGGDGDGDGDGSGSGSGSGSGGDGSGDGSGNKGPSKYDLSPPKTPSALIVAEWEKNHPAPRRDGFENIGNENKPANILSGVWSTIQYCKLQIENIIMKTKISGKTYKTTSNYNL